MVQKSLIVSKTSNSLWNILIALYYFLESIVLQFVPYTWRQKDVTGQTVLITGGGSGIGQLMATRFVAHGCKVILWDVNEDGMKKTVQIVSDEKLDASKVICYTINLCDRQAIYALAKRVHKEVGPVDILINNAGVVSGKHLLDIPDDNIDLTFKVNTYSHFYMLKAFLPDMIKRKSGHIVTVASVAGNTGCCALSDYCASKFANVGMDYALRLELAQAGLGETIKTTIVKPYFITTGMFAGVNPGIFPFLKPDYVAKMIVAGVLAEAHEIVIPAFFTHILWLIAAIPSKCLVPLAELFGAFEFMSNFHGRDNELPKQVEEVNNNLPHQKNFNNNNIKNN